MPFQHRKTAIAGSSSTSESSDRKTPPELVWISAPSDWCVSEVCPLMHHDVNSVCFFKPIQSLSVWLFAKGGTLHMHQATFSGAREWPVLVHIALMVEVMGQGYMDPLQTWRYREKMGPRPQTCTRPFTSSIWAIHQEWEKQEMTNTTVRGPLWGFFCVCWQQFYIFLW